jgi:hypothetical protein
VTWAVASPPNVGSTLRRVPNVARRLLGYRGTATVVSAVATAQPNMLSVSVLSKPTPARPHCWARILHYRSAGSCCP